MSFFSKNGYVSSVINSIPGGSHLSYLELGLETGENFKKICCQDKVSVDIDPQYRADYVMTTDEFFKGNKRRFDIIFIDADHHSWQVLNDYNHAIKICDQYIILHDMVPAKKVWTAQNKCGDAYKLLPMLPTNALTLDQDLGLTIVKMPADRIGSYNQNMSYQDLQKFLKEYRTYPLGVLLAIIRGEHDLY